jgi:glycosyltransferase involved in cell wall biosynthesis
MTANPGADRPPTVVLVLPWSPDHVGGVSEVVINLHRQLGAGTALRPRLLVDSYRHHAVTTMETRTLGNADTFYLPAPAAPGKGLRHFIAFACHLPGAVLRLAHYLRKENACAINFHFASLSVVTALLARRFARRQVRVILSFHGSDLQIAAACGFVQRHLWRGAVAACDAVVACSRAFGDEIIRQFPDIGGKLHVIHNGVDVAACRSARARGSLPPELQGRPYIACIATFEAKKAQDILLDSFGRIARQFPDLCLALAGGSGPTLARLRELAAAGPCKDRVFFYADLPHEHALAIIGGAGLLVLPSRQEPFGIVVLEAASLGVPVIASRVGGLPEIIDDGQSGVLVSPDNVDALTQAIGELLRNTALAASYSDNLLRTAQTRFPWRRAAEAYAALYVRDS